MENLSIETQIKLLNARQDCIIDLLGLQSELIKCVLMKIGTKDQYNKAMAQYKKHWVSIINDCDKTMNNIKEVAVALEAGRKK